MLPKRLSETTKLVQEHLPAELSALVIGYVRAGKSTWTDIAFHGEYETCMQIPPGMTDHGLCGACNGGHVEVAQLMIDRGATDWGGGFRAACHGGHKELVEFMIACGVVVWDVGLYIACFSGHKDIAELMIARGANCWNWGLDAACCGDHGELVDLMISHGASVCGSCKRPVELHRTRG